MAQLARVAPLVRPLFVRAIGAQPQYSQNVFVEQS